MNCKIKINNLTSYEKNKNAIMKYYNLHKNEIFICPICKKEFLKNNKSRHNKSKYHIIRISI